MYIGLYIIKNCVYNALLQYHNFKYIGLSKNNSL